MVGQHLDPAAQGSWALPQRPVEGRWEPAPPVCQHSQGGGGRRKQKLSRSRGKGAEAGGEAGVDRDGGARGCRQADTWSVCGLAPRRLISMNAITAAPPPLPTLPHVGLLRGRGRTASICSQAALASLPLEANPDGCFPGMLALSYNALPLLSGWPICGEQATSHPKHKAPFSPCSAPRQQVSRQGPDRLLHTGPAPRPQAPLPTDAPAFSPKRRTSLHSAHMLATVPVP